MSNIAAGNLEHKTLILSSEVVTLLIGLLSTAPFETRKEVAYTLGNICVGPTKGSDNKCDIIVDHLVPLVKGGCLPGFVNLVRSADLESARVGLQFLELVLIFYIVMIFILHHNIPYLYWSQGKFTSLVVGLLVVAPSGMHQ